MPVDSNAEHQRRSLASDGGAPYSHAASATCSVDSAAICTAVELHRRWRQLLEVARQTRWRHLERRALRLVLNVDPRAILHQQTRHLRLQGTRYVRTEFSSLLQLRTPFQD